MSRRPAASIVANPVLVGAVTTLVVVVAVFLAYNANNGLPFVPTQQLKVHVTNGANLVKGNEIREGGFRVGVVEAMRPIRLPSGRVGAELSLKLDRRVGELPVDTRIAIRPRSALGLKYVEVEKGTSERKILDGGTLLESQTRIPVDLDEYYNVFDRRTRDGSRAVLRGFGNAFAGRGFDLSVLIQRAPALFGYLTPVARNLADPRTDLKGFFKELSDTVRVIAPVSDVQARLFTDMADTFEAFSRDEQALKDTISKSPPSLDAGTVSLRDQRPFLRHSAAFGRDLRLSSIELRRALPTLNRALAIGIPVTRRSVQLNEDLQEALRALRDLVRALNDQLALRGLTATVTTLQPQLRFLGPTVTVCNSWNSFWTFNAEHFTAPDPTGTSERALLNSDGSQNDEIGSMGANEFANGSNVTRGEPEYLHGNFYGQAVEADGQADCEAGQQGYAYGSNRYGDSAYKRAVVDPGNRDRDGNRFVELQGPTYDKYDKKGNGVGLNTTRVPKGQTFTVEPGGRGARLEP